LSGVLYVIDGLEMGGGERGFLRLIRGAVEAGWSAAVATDPVGRFAAEAAAAGAEVVALPIGARHDPRSVWRVRRLAASGLYAVVHSQGARADWVARLALSGVSGVALVCTVQMPVDGFDVRPTRRRVYRLLDRFGRERVDRFIVVSDALHRTLVTGWGIEPGRVEVIPNGVDLDDGDDDRAAPAALRRALGLDPGAPLIGAVGRLVRQKGFEVLIEAMPAVLARVPGARLVVVGEGPERARLARLARERGVGAAVTFAGFRPDAPRLLAALDVLVLPSRREGSPLVTLEAMARGVPVVASDIDGIAEQVTDGVDGLVVPAGDAAALAAAVVRVLGDRTLAGRLGEAGRRRVRACFDARQMVARTLELYRAVARMPVVGGRRA
jgi:glycosyltransferase involved in cell wall biosynthesis